MASKTKRRVVVSGAGGFIGHHLVKSRSFCHVDDCVDGLLRLMDSGYSQPLNLGTEEIVTVNRLVESVIESSGKEISMVHDLTKPQGVRGRNSDNQRLVEVLGWEPKITLQEGIGQTYGWIWSELSKQGRASLPNPKVMVDIRMSK